MAISKVVYGATVLVDLTSDTVDAAHLAKGYTAHDKSGNLIVGTLEQKTDSNLLSGATPKLLNGATHSGNTYTIPEGGEYGTEYIEYQLDVPELNPGEKYCLLAYGHAQSGYRSFAVELHANGVAAPGSSSLLFTASPSIKAVSFDFASGAKPTKLVIKNASSSNSTSVDISSFMLMTINV